jgi:hypothetical protein
MKVNGGAATLAPRGAPSEALWGTVALRARFKRACLLSQGGEYLPNRVGYSERSQLAPCSPLRSSVRQRAIAQ